MTALADAPALVWERGGRWSPLPWMSVVPGPHGRYEARHLDENGDPCQRFTDDLAQAKAWVEAAGGGSVSDHDEAAVMRLNLL